MIFKMTSPHNCGNLEESPAGMGDHDGIAITCFLNYSRSKYENEQD